MRGVSLLSALGWLALAPSVLCLQCYKCADMKHFRSVADLVDDDGSLDEDLAVLPELLNSPEARAAMPPCTEFNPEEDRFKMECPLRADGSEHQGCAKNKVGHVTIRHCQEEVNRPGCVESDGMTVCYCRGELCNGVGRLTPALVLLLSAALLPLLWCV